MLQRMFRPPLPGGRLFGRNDAVILFMIGLVIYLGVRLALDAPDTIQGPDISLEPAALPYYAVRSLGRMLAAYLLSMIFSIIYGYSAARRPGADRWLMPILDVLQSVPILSFLPVVLLSLTAILPQWLAVELAAIILIFTSQAWNLTFSFYQSMITLPRELREAAAVFRLSAWLRFRTLELPFAALGLIWNSVMSWAGGWFFLMAAEIFTLGSKDFRLPGLGAYLQTAASEGDTTALVYGIMVLVLIITLLDQLIWRPLLAWAERYKVSQVESDQPATSWFYDVLRRSRLVDSLSARLFAPLQRAVNNRLNRPPAVVASLEAAETGAPPSLLRRLRRWLIYGVVVVSAAVLTSEAVQMLLALPPDAPVKIALGALATFLRVSLAVAVALLWTIPVGVLIGTNDRAAKLLQPVVQIFAAIPATALFPVLLLGLLSVPAGANIAAVLLMLLGTQWYLLFNVIAGASAIPQDLKYTSALLGLRRWRRWRTLILPALFPYVITGLITASGGAWNASIVAEYTHFGGETHQVVGLGALITDATARGDYPMLLASTLTMITIVVLVNRLVWRRLYRLAEYRYRMDQ